MADPLESPAAPVVRPFVEFRPLLRAFGIASDPKKLILAVVGLVLLTTGWDLLGRLFVNPTSPFGPLRPGSTLDIGFVPGATDPGEFPSWQITEPFRVVVYPFVTLFETGTGLRVWVQSALMAVWAIGVWGLLGGAIARIAVVQAAGERGVGLGTAIRFALGKAASFIGAPLTPMLGVALFSIGCGLFGLISRIPRVGPPVASVLGIVPILFGLLMALILAGLALAWPLMHATVAAEGEDAPDALSRSFSYVNQRLPRYLAHVFVAWLIGSIGLLLVILFAKMVLALAGWGEALGAPHPIPSTPVADSARRFWEQCVAWIAHGWIYSYFWSSASIIYLILRRDVDGAIWHDVYQPEHEADPFAPDLAAEVARPVEAEA